MAFINLKHNEASISAPLHEKVPVYIIFNRHTDGSMDLILRGNGDTWYYQQVLPTDEIVISQGTESIDYPESQANYEQLAEFHDYCVLKNTLYTKIELYDDIHNLGVELSTDEGVFQGLVLNRVVTLTVVYCRNEIMIQFGAMDTETFDMFTWYYKKMGEQESISIKIKEIIRDSDHLSEFPSKVNMIPTAEELSYNINKQKEKLQKYELKYRNSRDAKT